LDKEENSQNKKSNNELKMATIRPISITGANEGISNGVIEKQQKVDNDRFQPFEFC